jgi:diketogulonate reductase-like aldo/keto reductase
VQKQLREYCSKNGIQVVAYSSLGSGNLMSFEPVVKAAAGADVATLLLRWALRQVCLPLNVHARTILEAQNYTRTRKLN